MTLPEITMFNLHSKYNAHMHTAGGSYFKSLFPVKILLLYHSVDPTDSQTDTEQGQSTLI